MQDEVKYNEYNLFNLINKMARTPLQEFMLFVFNSGELLTPFLRSPGSRGNHHAFKGGLAYHSIHAAILGRSIAAHYNSLGIKVDEDLVTAGILIHDIGKIHCYKHVPCRHEPKCVSDCDEYGHVERAKLFHHIPMGFLDIAKLADKFNEGTQDKLSPETIDQLLHIILSHHGRRSWSSPVIPQFVEAYIVHSVEMMDGYVDKYNKGESVNDIYDH